MKKIGIILGCIALATVADAQALYNNGSNFYVGSTANVRVNGNADFQVGNTLTNYGVISFTGNVVNNQATNTTTPGNIKFEGSSAQAFSGSTTLNVTNLTINNVAGVIISGNIRVNGSLIFQSGILSATNSANPLVFTATGVASSPSNASHVNGYVIKEGTGSFSFPVGDGTVYQKLDVNLSANSHGLRGRYYAANAGAATFATGGASGILLNNYNTQEYWDLAPVGVGTATGTVAIYWDAYKNASQTSSTILDVMQVAHKTNAGWINEGASAVAGTMSAGNVTSKVVSSWSPFTLGTVLESALPVSWIHTDGRFNDQHQAVIGWKVDEKSMAYFEVLRSTDGRSFHSIGRVESKGDGVHTYEFADSGISDRSVYYRVKQTDLDGKFSLSRIIALLPAYGVRLSSAYPNPTKACAQFDLGSRYVGSRAILLNNLGVVVKDFTISDEIASVDLTRFTPGLYLLRLEDGKVVKIVKE